MLFQDPAALPGLHYPIPGALRIAVLSTPVRCGNGVRCFVKWTCHQLMRANPEAIAGPLGDLLEVARLRDAGMLLNLELRSPLVVFSTLTTGVMQEPDRERLWEAFGLPFFEQIRDAQGRLLAYECDARDGFHWVGEEASPGGLPRPQRCACGRPTPARTRTSVQTGFAWQATTGQ